jgi:hypothetical protein
MRMHRDQIGKPVLARAAALGALDAQHVKLADQLREDDRASYSIRPGFIPSYRFG